MKILKLAYLFAYLQGEYSWECISNNSNSNNDNNNDREASFF